MSSARPRQSAPVHRSNRTPAVLPAYQPLKNPLNESAQRALHDLPQAHSLANLNKHLQTANDTLTNAAGDVNDRYQCRAAYQLKQNARTAQGKGEKDDEGNRAEEEMRENVDEMTSRMEEGVRKIIDARAIVAGVESALRELDRNVAAGNGAMAPTQSTLGASQFRQRRQTQDDDDSEDESSEGVVIGPTTLLKRKITEQQVEYEDLSMQDRYATNNDYIGFKQMVHDALHPGENAPPVPHASTWFSQPNAEVTPGGTKRDQAVTTDDDDDLEIASERINIKCPLTLLPMKNPVTSKKCPHSFEKEAITEMISISTVRIGGGSSQTQRRGPAGGEKAIKCPVCEVMLAATDLYSDPVLLRKIKRVQAERRLQDEESDEEMPTPRGSPGPQAEEIGSADEGGNRSGAARMRSLAPRVKAEKMASSARQVSTVPNSQPAPDSGVVDIEDEDEDEE